MNKGRRYAVLIGSSRFNQKQDLTPLKCPEHDVDGMHEILSAKELGAFGEVFVFKNAESYAILHTIEEMLAEATIDDQVLIYYSGHGKTDLPGRLYLTTTNTQIKKLVTTSIPVETLRTLIDISSCRKIILILDCCYGGAAGRAFVKGKIDETLQELARGNGVYILTASTATQSAEEREGDNHGLLTKHIILGIKQGEADTNDDGLVSMDDLYRYVFAKVTSESYQEPMRWALNVKGEDLIIARASRLTTREQQQLLTEKVIEIRSFLPPRIFTKAIRAIEARRMPYYEIMLRFYREHWPVGRFLEEWDQVESARRQQPEVVVKTPAPDQKPPRLEVVESLSQPEPQTHEPESNLRGVPTIQDLQKESQPEERFSSSISRRWHRFGMLAAVMATALLISPLPRKPGIQNLRLSPDGFCTLTLDERGHGTLGDGRATSFAENLDGFPLEMIRVPGGSFLMGSPESESGHSSTEGPQQQITVPTFYIGRVEVTREQWRKVAEWQKAGIDLEADPSYHKDSPKQPVEMVTMEEALEFCRRLANKTDNDYRLPTEAEWEYAARTSGKSPFTFGKTITLKVANYNSEMPYRLAPNEPPFGRTIEVGRLGLANAFGLHDLHGNVWEWCSDRWREDYNLAPSPWEGKGGGVARGGSYTNSGMECRSARRLYVEPRVKYRDIGFRVVCSAKRK